MDWYTREELLFTYAYWEENEVWSSCVGKIYIYIYDQIYL